VAVDVDRVTVPAHDLVSCINAAVVPIAAGRVDRFANVARRIGVFAGDDYIRVLIDLDERWGWVLLDNLIATGCGGEAALIKKSHSHGGAKDSEPGVSRDPEHGFFFVGAGIAASSQRVCSCNQRTNHTGCMVI